MVIANDNRPNVQASKPDDRAEPSRTMIGTDSAPMRILVQGPQPSLTVP